MDSEASFRTNSSRYSHVIIMTLVSALAVLAVALRLWARRIMRAKHQISDYMCILGLILGLTDTAYTIHSQVYWRLGEAQTQMGNPQSQPHLIELQAKSQIVGEVLWAAATFFVRASVIHLYIALFPLTTFRRICYGVCTLNFIFLLTTTLGACLICRPMAASWNPHIPGGHCGNFKALALYFGILNLLIDIVTVILPMPILWGLQMAKSKKFVLTAIFGMGFTICGLTLTRLVVVSRIKQFENAQAKFSLIALLIVLEIDLGVINGCLPVMKPVFDKLCESSTWKKVKSTCSISHKSSSSSSKDSFVTSDTSSEPSKLGTAETTRDAPQRWHGFLSQTKSRWSNLLDGRSKSKDLSEKSTGAASNGQLLPRYVDPKAAQVMFGYPRQAGDATDHAHGGPSMTSDPSSKPSLIRYHSIASSKGPRVTCYAGSIKPPRAGRDSEPQEPRQIHVRQDWDVERRPLSQTFDTDKLMLECPEKYGK